MVAALRAESGEGWIRAWGYDDAFLLERRHPTSADLAAIARPVVLHHRTGHVAVLNEAAIAELGAPTVDGVLVDGHDILSRVPRLQPDHLAGAVSAVCQDWARRGITAFTDATHTNGAAELDLMDSWCSDGTITQRVEAMIGTAHLGALAGPGAYGAVQVRHAKVMADIAAGVATATAAGWPTAVHVMDVDTLDETLAAFEDHPPPAGSAHRIEHNALCIPEQVHRIAACGATVVVNPAFLLHRAAKYREELSDVEQGWLVRIRSLVDAGVRVAAGSDSPVVPARPEETRAAAEDHPFAPAESVSEEISLLMCQDAGRPSI